MINRLREIFSDKNHENKFIKILEGAAVVTIMDSISKSICDENRKYDDIRNNFNLKGLLTNPLNSGDKIKSIHIEKIKVKNSATKPLLIPCELDNNQITNMLYKKEDIRKDLAIMNLISLADMILKNEEGMDLELVTYNILPTSKYSGLIEVIEDCDTIYYIQQSLNSTILNYILEINGDMKVKEVRNQFIKSTAAYCVITYLFGIGDRHLDNIMVKKDGRLFHIDFGYILGNDPMVNNPGMRITDEMIEAIGGFSSKYYEEFTDLCTKIYNCLRRNIDIFMNVLAVLPYTSDINLTTNEINNFLIRRFIPGENNIDAKIYLVNQIDKQSYINNVKDWCHFFSKEKTVNNAMNRLAHAVSELVTTNMFNNTT
jgi:phosphatidylinositol kinase/protein kinase (PI-3  family)